MQKLNLIIIGGGMFVSGQSNDDYGTILPAILQAKKNNSLVFVDECFIELVPQHDESILDMIPKNDNLIILRSLTKSFGLAGIRIGYGVSSKKIISILNKLKSHGMFQD